MVTQYISVSDIIGVEAAQEESTDDFSISVDTTCSPPGVSQLGMSRETAIKLKTEITNALQGTVKPNVDDVTLRRWLGRRRDRRCDEIGQERWGEEFMDEWCRPDFMEIARAGGIFTPAEIIVQRAADLAETAT
jgi:hypothetical protein